MANFEDQYKEASNKCTYAPRGRGAKRWLVLHTTVLIGSVKCKGVGGGLKSRKVCVRTKWMSPNKKYGQWWRECPEQKKFEDLQWTAFLSLFGFSYTMSFYKQCTLAFTLAIHQSTNWHCNGFRDYVLVWGRGIQNLIKGREVMLN